MSKCKFVVLNRSAFTSSKFWSLSCACARWYSLRSTSYETTCFETLHSSAVSIPWPVPASSTVSLLPILAASTILARTHRSTSICWPSDRVMRGNYFRTKRFILACPMISSMILLVTSLAGSLSPTLLWRSVKFSNFFLSLSLIIVIIYVLPMPGMSSSA